MFVKSVGKRDSNPNFSSQDGCKRAAAFVNLDNRQLQDLAYVMSYDKKEQKKQQNSVKHIFYAIPVVDTLAGGILTNGYLKPLVKQNALELKEGIRLSGKTLSMASTALHWSKIIVGIGVYNKIKKAIVSRSPALQNFEQNNPGTGFLADIGMIFGGYVLIQKGLNKVLEKVKTAHPKEARMADTRLMKKLKGIIDWLDKTKINKNVLPKLTEGVTTLGQKAPWLIKASKTVLAHSVYIMAGLGILKMISNSHHNQRKVEAKFYELKEAQAKTAKHLSRACQTCDSCEESDELAE